MASTHIENPTIENFKKALTDIAEEAKSVYVKKKNATFRLSCSNDSINEDTVASKISDFNKRFIKYANQIEKQDIQIYDDLMHFYHQKVNAEYGLRPIDHMQFGSKQLKTVIAEFNTQSSDLKKDTFLMLEANILSVNFIAFLRLISFSMYCICLSHPLILLPVAIMQFINIRGIFENAPNIEVILITLCAAALITSTLLTGGAIVPLVIVLGALVIFGFTRLAEARKCEQEKTLSEAISKQDVSEVSKDPEDFSSLLSFTSV